MKRIVITGAESTGKTRLTRALSDHFNAPHSKEYVRSFVDSINRPIVVSDFCKIVQGQIALEKEACLQARKQTCKLVFHDTNILSNLIYGRHYLEASAKDIETAGLGSGIGFIGQAPYDLYLFCQNDIPWKPDGRQRDSARARDHLHEQFAQSLTNISALNATNAKTVLIYGSPEKRLNLAINAVDACLRTEA